MTVGTTFLVIITLMKIRNEADVKTKLAREGGAIWIGGYLDQICDFGNFPRKGII